VLLTECEAAMIEPALRATPATRAA
jgi:hypothetical protein